MNRQPQDTQKTLEPLSTNLENLQIVKSKVISKYDLRNWPWELVEPLILKTHTFKDLRSISKAYQGFPGFQSVNQLVEDLTFIKQRTRSRVWPVLGISYNIIRKLNPTVQNEIAERIIRNARLLNVKLTIDWISNFIRIFLLIR